MPSYEEKKAVFQAVINLWGIIVIICRRPRGYNRGYNMFKKKIEGWWAWWGVVRGGVSCEGGMLKKKLGGRGYNMMLKKNGGGSGRGGGLSSDNHLVDGQTDRPT
ncbi:hypothetical protein DPMN_181204 [Dreissena polymorpha]|uniref:Uncharacterized protein n=1 Tax=Dreissena polymorpha TaxID=45954 RepID=A0A9D4DDR1_DREPO|nr:hypothetical protein DPMN_181204 [Dreissena polymorpha]